jgi:hypothetical protein
MTMSVWLIASLLATEPGAPARLRPEEAQALASRLTERQPFLESEEARTEKATLGRYFDADDYRRLRGNPILGYWDTGGFRWKDDRVAWLGIDSKAKCSAISPTVWKAAFEYSTTKRKVSVDGQASVRIRGACVWAVIEPSKAEPVPGVLIEVRIESPSGTLRYRFGMGKPTVEDAVGAALDFIIGFARTAR